MALGFHPLANVFPLIEGELFEELIGSIRQGGLREPITLFEGQILDGRNRYRACEIIGVEPRTELFAGDDPIQFVVDKNIYRRHLNESQRAAVAAQLVSTSWGGCRIKGRIQPLTYVQASKLLKVGRDTLALAKLVLDHGTTEQMAAVRSGEVAVSAVGGAIRKARSKERAAAGFSLSSRGKNPGRIAGRRMRVELWGRVREALIHLTSLPLPAEVAAMVRGNNKTTIVVDERLEKSLKWLEDFAHAWRDRDKTAA